MRWLLVGRPLRTQHQLSLTGSDYPSQANRSLTRTLYSPSLHTCRLRLRSTTATTLLSSATYHTAQRTKPTVGEPRKQTQQTKGTASNPRKQTRHPREQTQHARKKHAATNVKAPAEAAHGSADNRKRGTRQRRGIEDQANKHKEGKTGKTKLSSNASHPRRRTELEFDLASQKDKLRTILTRENLNGMPSVTRDKLLADAAKTFGATLSWKQESMAHALSGRPYFRVHCTVQIPDHEELAAVGDGFGPSDAERAASLNALVRMHEAGLLHLIWAPASPTEQINKNLHDHLQDVFNYAASYGSIPEYSIRNYGPNIVAEIKMPEHGIEAIVSTRHSTNTAWALAAFEFKRQAEMHEKNKSADTVTIKHPTPLSTATASDFLKFCRDSGKLEGRVRVEAKSDGTGSGAAVGVATLNGGALGPETPVVNSEAKATKMAQLIGALTLAKENPQLLEAFHEALLQGNGHYLGKTQPMDTFVSLDSLRQMESLKKFASGARFALAADPAPEQEHQEAIQRIPRSRVLTQDELVKKSAALQEKQEKYQRRPDLEQLRQIRSELPMTQFAPQVLDIVHNNIYCVIIGETGSGKTTQVPQILLEHAIANGSGASCNIICTQPRRIAATSVAKRVADERGERLQDTVGYHVRFEARLPKHGGSIVYCTTGILLKQLQHAPDDVYDSVSHLVIDEVHERDMPIDFLLIMLKNTMAARAAKGKKVPRVVLMSATIDAERFATYFRGSLTSDKTTECPTLRVPGRTFPVKEMYLGDILEELENKYDRQQLRLIGSDKPTTQYLEAEQGGPTKGRVDNDRAEERVIDWKKQATTVGSDHMSTYDNTKEDTLVPLGLAATTIAHLATTTEGGAILVFLTGLDDIVKLQSILLDQRPLDVDFADGNRFRIFMLHSSIQESQRTVFETVPSGCRKIILSTNIAETSVTIPDVQFVVDTGKCREKQYDQVRRLSQLQCSWISRSNAKQRAGRAGRVRNGHYYALFTRSRHESMRATGLPELLRSDLQEICLEVKSQAFQMPVRDFLGAALEPPSPVAVESAMKSLTALDALTEEEELTPLGRILASLPVHPALGKMIVLGVIFDCLDPMIVLGAAAHERPLFVSPLAYRREVDAVRREYAGTSWSDHIMLYNAFCTARQMAAEAENDKQLWGLFDQNFFHMGAFKSIDSTAKEIVGILQKAGLIHTHSPGFKSGLEYGGKTLNGNSSSDAMIKALLVAGLHPHVAVQTRPGMFRTSREKHVFIHPQSVISKEAEGANLLAFTSLSLGSDGGRIGLRDVTKVTPLMVLLFGGHMTREDDGPILEMDKWLRFYVNDVFRTTAPHAAPRIVYQFEHTLQRILAVVCKKLAMRDPQLDELRRTFALGLKDILDREARSGPQRRLSWAIDNDSYRTSRSRSRDLGPKGILEQEAGRGPVDNDRQSRLTDMLYNDVRDTW